MFFRCFRVAMLAWLAPSVFVVGTSFADEPIDVLEVDDHSTLFNQLDEADFGDEAAIRLVGTANSEKSGKGQDSGGGCDCCLNGRHWLSADYLMWWTKGMRIPPLVTTTTVDPPVLGSADGSLDQAGHVILYGDEEILRGRRSGMRFQAGTWLDDCCRLGFEADYYFLNEATERFSASSPGTVGSQVISRPFYDILRPGATAMMGIPGPIGNIQQVAFPDQLSGTITVTAQSDFQSAGTRMRYALCCETSGCQTAHDGSEYHFAKRLDFLLGYRFARLNESLGILEELDETGFFVPPQQFQVRDSFRTQNDFHGAELGVRGEWTTGRLSLDLLGKLALGNVRQRVAINGSTDVTVVGMPPEPTAAGGLLALTTNIGSYEQNSFAVIPELGATLGLQLTKRLRGTIGYSFVYWSNVVRPGDQIDLDLNQTFIPRFNGGVAGSGFQRPGFNFRETDYWAQGLNVGLDYRW